MSESVSASSEPADRPIQVLIGSPAVGESAVGESVDPEATILLDLGDDHPSRAGLLELRIWLDPADRQLIDRAEVRVGAMHRGTEKLYEVRDYRQILMLADRHDWQAPAAAELAIALAAERLLGVEPPARAQWLRTLLAEHTRLLSHLSFLTYLWQRDDRPSPVPQLRERLRGQLQAMTGNRVHPMINRLGGLAADVDDHWLDEELALLPAVAAGAREAATMIRELAPTAARVPRLTRDQVLGYGVSGPAARGSGVDLDLRRRQPYLVYRELVDELAEPAAPDELEAPPMDGSPVARLWVLVAELGSSASMITAAAQRLRELPGPVSVRLGKIVKLPEGEIQLSTEAPLGTAGCYLVSRGEKTPWRLKLRTPSFNNIAALEGLLPGCRVDDLELVLASIGYVVGDIDK